MKQTVEERAEVGRAARKRVSRTDHGRWAPAPDRRDPIGLLVEQNESRLEFLVPLRHRRMSTSPFAFYRGAARVMAADLAGSPASGLEVQLGGDAHLSNFGGYASPSRELIFDANDFDETLRGPWEWDLKRLAASFTIASRHRGFSTAELDAITARVVRAYREAMARFADQSFLDVWYDHVKVDDLRAGAGGEVPSASIDKAVDKFSKKARRKDNLQALDRMTEVIDGVHHIRHGVPGLYPVDTLPAEARPDALRDEAEDSFTRYRDTLAEDRRWLLERYDMVDLGLKVVGVGSVGTRCMIALFQGRDSGDPLFLQAKEANASVLEEFLAPSPYPNHGQRVVEGQRMVQAQSDIFLGWTRTSVGRDFYVRQLRDWKGSVDTESAGSEGSEFYAALCGLTLARGHARSGDPVAIAAYVGNSDRLDRSISEFARRYAEQNEQDYAAFMQEISDGHLDIAPPEDDA